MSLALGDTIALLERTPLALAALLAGLPDAWTRANEGPETWSPFDVIGHLIHGERTDWMVRARIILEQGEARPFDRFDRLAQFRENAGRPLGSLLEEFAKLRGDNLTGMRAWRLGPRDLERRGTHPVLGTVTLRQLLATWAVHDLTHLHQVARVYHRSRRHADRLHGYAWSRELPESEQRPAHLSRKRILKVNQGHKVRLSNTSSNQC